MNILKNYLQSIVVEAMKKKDEEEVAYRLEEKEKKIRILATCTSSHHKGDGAIICNCEHIRNSLYGKK